MKAAWIGDNAGWWLYKIARELYPDNKHKAALVYNCWMQYIFGRPCQFPMPPEVRAVADCLRRALISPTRFWFERAWRCLPEDVRVHNAERDLKWDVIYADEPDI